MRGVFIERNENKNQLGLNQQKLKEKFNHFHLIYEEMIYYTHLFECKNLNQNKNKMECKILYLFWLVKIRTSLTLIGRKNNEIFETFKWVWKKTTTTTFKFEVRFFFNIYYFQKINNIKSCIYYFNFSFF